MERKIVDNPERTASLQPPRAILGTAIEDLSQQFAIALLNQKGSGAVSKSVNENCDIQIVAYMAWRCLFDAGATKRAIKQREQKVLRRLREHAREFSNQLERLQAAGHDAGVAQTRTELENVRRMIANARNNRVYDTKREGIAMNSRMLWMLRGYVQACTGRAVKSSDLARILDAAQRAVHPRTSAKFDPELVRRNLRTFEKNRRTLLTHAQQK